MTVSPALAASFERLRQTLAGRTAEPAPTVPATSMPPEQALHRKQAARMARVGRVPTVAPTPRLPRLVPVQSPESLTELLTACMADAPCRDSARAIYRVLHTLALEASRYQGHKTEHITRAVFHLPAELLMAHVGLRKSAFYDNLKYLHKLGLVASDAHMGKLRGEMVATGTLWVVSLRPEAVLSGRANGARILHEDWQREWRNLDRDVKAGDTVYNALKGAGESLNTIKGNIDLNTLIQWTLKPFKNINHDTVTVRPALGTVLDAIWSLGSLADLNRSQRADAVNNLARKLAQSMGDGERSMGWWRWLLWQVIRASDAGQNLAEQVSTVLATVLRDIQSDESVHGVSTVRKAGAVAIAALRRAGLYDLLRGVALTRVGVAPRPA